MALVCLILLILFIIKPQQSMEESNFQQVQLGDHAILSCDISYHYDITWLKHQPEKTPIIVLLACLSNGNVIDRFQHSVRFKAEIANRSLALKITNLQDTDLGLYFCMGMVGNKMTVGRGITLHGNIIDTTSVTGLHTRNNPSATQGLVSGLETQIDSSATSSLASPVMPTSPFGLTFIHLYAAAVGLGLLGMIAAVCITHHKAKSRNKTT